MEPTTPNIDDALLLDEETVRRAKFFARWGTAIGILLLAAGLLAHIPAGNMGLRLADIVWPEPAIPPGLPPGVAIHLIEAKLASPSGVLVMLPIPSVVVLALLVLLPRGNLARMLLLLYARHGSSLSLPGGVLTKQDRKYIKHLQKSSSAASQVCKVTIAMAVSAGLAAILMSQRRPLDPVLQHLRESMAGDPALPAVLDLAIRIQARTTAATMAGVFAELLAFIPVVVTGLWFLTQNFASRPLLKLLTLQPKPLSQ